MAFERVLLVKPQGAAGLGIIVGALIPLGMEYIAACLEDIAEVRCIDHDVDHFSYAYFRKYVKQFKPDVVGFSMSATEHGDGLRLAKIAKECGVKATVMGGFHPTAISEALLAHPQVDLVVWGEGEFTMREIVQAGTTQPEGILGVSYKDGMKVIHNSERPLVEDLDIIPFPARHLRWKPYLYRFSYALEKQADQISFSRGCYGTCTFCCEPRMSKSYIRFRSPQNIIDELEEIVKFHKYRPLHMLVADPDIMGNPKHLDKILDALLEFQEGLRNKISFNAMVTCRRVAKYPEIMAKMCRAGINKFCMGIESPSQDDLNMTKKATLSTQIQEKAIEIIRNNNGVAGGTYVIGLPWHTKAEIKKFPDYGKKIGQMYAAFGIATPFPDSDFYDDLNQKGLIYERDWNKFDEMHGVFQIDGIKKGEMECLNAYCLGRFYTPDTLFDQIQVESRRRGRKIHIFEFFSSRINGLYFMTHGGLGLRRHQFNRDGIFFFQGFGEATGVRGRSNKLQIHKFVEMSRFLHLIGTQKIQISILLNRRPIMSTIVKTNRHALEWIDTLVGKVQDASVDIELPYEMFGVNSVFSSLRFVANFLLKPLISVHFKKQLNRLRFFFAIFIELILRIGSRILNI
ncbi:MAG TPA: radical SAM protein [Candidatus Deferrimicrobium sp.]|nr:radical SAM protein [Candidatus Deferrimicrobium sp.]